jgi:hypothetical protein
MDTSKETKSEPGPWKGYSDIRKRQVAQPASARSGNQRCAENKTELYHAPDDNGRRFSNKPGDRVCQQWRSWSIDYRVAIARRRIDRRAYSQLDDVSDEICLRPHKDVGRQCHERLDVDDVIENEDDRETQTD